MRILITNDDGIDSPGIHELAMRAKQHGHDVFIVAPDHDASGTATSLGRISADLPIRATRHSGEIEAWSISGPPALCVVAANLEAFGEKPDVVLSGINRGLNTGRSTLHSGTVGAALTAQNFGLRGLAVSLETSDLNPHWETASQLAMEVLPSLLNGPNRGALNLNVPSLSPDEVQGIRWTGLAAFNSVKSSVSKVSEGHIHFELIPTDYDPEETTDLGAVRAGFASLTALHGNVEVWGPLSDPGDVFERGNNIYGVTAGHELRPAKSVME
jgi:5'-nucleotidase